MATYEEAQQLYEKKDYSQSIKVVTKLIETNAPNPHLLYSMRAKAYYSLKEYTHALSDAQISLKHNRNHGGCEVLGLTYYCLTKYFDSYLWVLSALIFTPESKVLLELKTNHLKRVHFWNDDPFGFQHDYTFTRSFLKYETLTKRLTPDEYRAMGYTVECIPGLCARLSADNDDLENQILMDVYSNVSHSRFYQLFRQN
jgi:tetratricopeptide (TPR) repeat protein